MPTDRHIRGPRRAASAPNGRGALVGPRRCLHCGGDLTMLMPALETSINVVEIVARNAIENRQTTAADVAPLLDITDARAAGQLRRACMEGLLTRSKLDLVDGGFVYVYWPDARAVAYVRQQSLAEAMRELLFKPRAVSSR